MQCMKCGQNVENDNVFCEECLSEMKKYGLDQKKSQATTIAVILPITVISAVIYALKGYYSPTDTIRYIPFGLLGAVIGVKITKKIKGLFLKKLFSLFMIWAGYRMLFR